MVYVLRYCELEAPKQVERGAYKTVKRKETFEYLASKDKRVFKVLYLHGEFIQVDLVVTSLKSEEIEHINTHIIIDKYPQPMLGWLSDSYHHRQVIGAHKTKKKKILLMSK